jgi:hypothetical protein
VRETIANYRIQPADPETLGLLPAIEAAAVEIFPAEDIAPELRQSPGDRADTRAHASAHGMLLPRISERAGSETSRSPGCGYRASFEWTHR